MILCTNRLSGCSLSNMMIRRTLRLHSLFKVLRIWVHDFIKGDHIFVLNILLIMVVERRVYGWKKLSFEVKHTHINWLMFDEKIVGMSSVSKSHILDGKIDIEHHIMNERNHIPDVDMSSYVFSMFFSHFQ